VEVVFRNGQNAIYKTTKYIDILNGSSNFEHIF